MLVNALASEIELQKGYLEGGAIETIYFGGGTPSLLLPSELELLFKTIRKNFTIQSNAEITLEANPDDLSPGKLEDLKSIGVNRLSIGIQSFDDEILRSLNRVHDSSMARRSIESAYAVGFNNISIDLIYSIPSQEDDLWRKNILEALRFQPTHISAYSLTIEEKTVFGTWAARGKFKAVDDDHSALQLQLLVEMLTADGLEQYEVSNFCRPGYMSRHNSNYWRGNSYLGIGPSAHSYNGVSRQHNVSNNFHYVENIQKKKVPSSLEILTREDKINEYLLTRLRTSWGADLEQLRLDFGIDIVADNATYLDQLQQNALAVLQSDTLVLTGKGKLLADKIASDLFVLPDSR